jgi:hypothetical protein
MKRNSGIMMTEPYPKPKAQPVKRNSLKINHPIHTQTFFYRMERMLNDGEVKVESNVRSIKHE